MTHSMTRSCTGCREHGFIFERSVGCQLDELRIRQVNEQYERPADLQCSNYESKRYFSSTMTLQAQVTMIFPCPLLPLCWS